MVLARPTVRTPRVESEIQVHSLDSGFSCGIGALSRLSFGLWNLSRLLRRRPELWGMVAGEVKVREAHVPAVESDGHETRAVIVDVPNM